MIYELEPFHRDIPDEDLLADLRRVAKDLGKNRVTYREYNERGRFTAGTLAERFGSWFAAIDKANLERTMNRNISDEELFVNLVEVWTALGRQPRSRDLRPGPSRFSWATYAYRFSTWRKALAEFVRWANDGKFVPDSEGSAKKSGKRTPRNINWRLRALVLMRDRARCRLCGAGPSEGVTLHVDHVKPWSKDGETVIENLQILCNVCNIGKGDIELKTDN
ncbi:MAG TPA: HNH endonuclease [Candidatus Acidoferrales bacterium]|nr:HNH endonuclease [Candidatus Acidoferrales bacterium]